MRGAVNGKAARKRETDDEEEEEDEDPETLLKRHTEEQRAIEESKRWIPKAAVPKLDVENDWRSVGS